MIKIPAIPYKLGKADTMERVVIRAGFPPKATEKIFKAPYNASARKKYKWKTHFDVKPGEVVWLPMFSRKELWKVRDKLFDLIKGVDRSLDQTFAIRDKVDADIKRVRKRQDVTSELRFRMSEECFKLEQAVKKKFDTCRAEADKSLWKGFFSDCEPEFKKAKPGAAAFCKAFEREGKLSQKKDDALLKSLRDTRKQLIQQLDALTRIRQSLSRKVDQVNELDRQTF